MPNEDSNPITNRDVRNMERKKRVTEILNEKDFRNELEDVMVSQKGEGNRPMFMAGLKMSGSNNSMSGVSEFKGMSGMPERQINDITGSMCDRYSKAERAQRCKLAALYRLTAQFGWDHLIYSHITARVPGEPDRFLINPYGMQYSEITASSLIKVDAEGNIVDPGTTILPVNKAGFALNTALHSTGANCVYHTHSDAGTAISAMKCGLLNLCQEALQVRPVSYSNYQGFAQSEQEKRDVAESLEEDSKVLILRNHGIVSVGKSIEEAFLYMCQLTKACEVQWRTLRCGIEHNLMFESDVAEQYPGLPVELVCNPNGREYGPGELEFESYMRKLDNTGQNTGYPYKMPALFREQLPTYSNVQYPPIVPGIDGPPSDQERSRPNSSNRAAWFKNNAPDNAAPPARPAPSKRGIPDKPAKPAKPGQGVAPSRTKLTAFDDIFQTKPEVADSIDPKKRQTVEPGRSPRMDRLERELEQLQNKHGRPSSSDGEVRTSSSSPTSSRPPRRKPRRKRSEIQHEYVEEMFAFIGPIDTAIQKRKGSDEDSEAPPRPPPPGTDSETDSHSSGVVISGYVEECKFTVEDVLNGRTRLITEDLSDEDCFGLKEGKWSELQEGFDGSYERAKERHAVQIFELQVEIEEAARLRALKDTSSDEGSGVEMILSDGRKPQKPEDEEAKKGDSRPRSGSDNTVTHEYIPEQLVEHEMIIDGKIYPVDDDELESDDASFVSLDDVSDSSGRITDPSTDGKRSDVADVESVSSGSSPSFELMVEGDEVEPVKDAMPIHTRDITTDTMRRTPRISTLNMI